MTNVVAGYLGYRCSSQPGFKRRDGKEIIFVYNPSQGNVARVLR
jgi:hypothetical protein